MIVFTNASIVLQLQSLVNSVFDGLCECRLYQNPIEATGSTVMGDMVECNFGGYAAVNPATWQAVTLIAMQTARCKQNVAIFTCDGNPPSNLVYGGYFTAGTELLAVTVFEAGPVLIDTAGEQVGVDMPIFLGPQGAA